MPRRPTAPGFFRQAGRLVPIGRGPQGGRECTVVSNRGGGLAQEYRLRVGAVRRRPAQLHGTFDNSATTEELRFLARAIGAAHEASWEAAFQRGLDHILDAQYQNGGWPQSSPPGKGYDRYITFNDDTMVRLMNLLHDVATDERYRFVDADRRRRAATAFDRGVECIVRCQVRVGDRLTVWCAQHDEVDLQPRPARTFELASLSGSESARIVRLLMSLEKPSPEVMQAIDAAIVWFDQAKLTGIRQEYADDPQAPGGRNKIVVQDATARPYGRVFTI